MKASDLFVKALENEGVEYIFGYPGGACMPIFDALVDAPEQKIILVRHEQGATHMAEGGVLSACDPCQPCPPLPSHKS